MENNNKTTFNMKKLEDGIQKLKDNKILPKNFKLCGVGQYMAWGDMTQKRKGEKQKCVVCWSPTGIGLFARKNDNRQSHILDEDKMIEIGISLSFKIAKKLYIGTLTNN